MVGILNIGRGILSRSENVLVFGANCSENCKAVQRYVRKLVCDIQYIEKQSFACTYTTFEGKTCTVNVKFRISEYPNDLKMVAFLCGELSNSATYFCSFANVCTSNAIDLTGTFGKEKDKLWQPWSYSQRVRDAKNVEKFKKTVAKQEVSESTKRSKITSFIAGKKSRQEFEPLLGPLVDRIHIDPLHLKNNACALAHRLLLNEVLSVSHLGNSMKTFSQVPNTSPFHKYITTMQNKCNLRRLANKIIRWYNECQSIGKSFEYRFTGKDSRCFLQNFMFLIDVVEPFLKDKTKALFTIHVLAYLCLTLRDCVSVFTRIEVTDSQLDDLERNCRTYYVLHYLHFNHHPTAWTLGNVVPHHAKDMKLKYGFGLGLNSMEGREAKHISISQYSKNTHYKSRWEQIFQHEYISLLWLREKGYNSKKLASDCSLRYMYTPKRASVDPKFCYCGCEKETESATCCRFCGHKFRKLLRDKVKYAVTKK